MRLSIALALLVLPAFSQPEPSRSVEIPYDNSKFGVEVAPPVFQNGFLIGFNRGYTRGGTPSLWEYDRTGKLTLPETLLEFPGATRSQIHAVAADSHGNIWLSAEVWNSNAIQAEATVLARFSPGAGLDRVIRVPSFVANALSVGPSGRIFAFGTDPITEMDDAPAQLTVRVFNPDGTLLASLLPRSSLGNPKDVSHYSAIAGASQILATPSGAVVLAPSASKIAALKLDPSPSAHVEALSFQTSGPVKIRDAASTSDGRIFAAVYYATGGNAGAEPKYGILDIQTNGAAGSLTPLSAIDRDANRLLGADGPQLVIRTGCCRLQWLNPPATRAAAR